MNRERLIELEALFLRSWPQGFDSPEMVELGKKHKMDRMVDFVAESFCKEAFDRPGEIIENIGKAVTRSSMVSVFEKARFRDYIKNIGGTSMEGLVFGLKERLHGNEQLGFETMVEILSEEKLAKWPIISAIPIYFRPNVEVFIKPTTVKAIIAALDIDLIYKPQPTWEFYSAYRDEINRMKKEVSPSLSPNNAAFSGFFMVLFQGL